jgi:hypothetical protein
MRFLEFFEQAPGEPVLRHRAGKLTVTLKLLALLRSHVGFKKRLTRIIALRLRCNDSKQHSSEQKGTKSSHAGTNPKNNRGSAGCNAKEKHHTDAGSQECAIGCRGT